MIDFDTWLKTPGLFRCILVELNYIDNAQVKTAYLSNAAFRTGATDNPTHTAYDPFVIGGLDITRAMTEVFIGRSTSQVSELELFLNAITTAFEDVSNQQIKIYMGDKSWSKSDFKLVFVGVCDGSTTSKNTLSIAFKERAAELDTPVLTEVYANGPSEGQLKPLLLGQCFNITPKLIDAVNHVYQFNSVPSQAVTAAKFNGDLVLNSSYTVNLAEGTITFTTQPIGNITLDVQGAVINTSYLSTATDFITYLVATRLNETVNITGLPSYTLGLYIDSDSSYSSVLDDICKSCGAYWYFNRLGAFICQQFNGTGGAVTSELTDDQNLQNTREQRTRLSPTSTLALGYQRNYTPLNNVAAVVFDTNAGLAQQLSNTELIVNASNAAPGNNVKVSTLVVNKSDAQTELNRRLALKSIPRYIYQTEQLSGPFNWLLGDELKLETIGKNGERAILTRINENLLTGHCALEFWQ